MQVSEPSITIQEIAEKGRDDTLFLSQTYKWSTNNFRTRGDVISVPAIGYRNIAE